MLDPRMVHAIDSRIFLAHTVRLDHGDLTQVRTEFARYLTTPAARQHTTWQAAWNAWTGATPHAPGRIKFTPYRCHVCHGKGFTHRNVPRNLTRTGTPYGCGECNGSGRGSRITVVARYMTIPTDSATPTEPTTEVGQ